MTTRHRVGLAACLLLAACGNPGTSTTLPVPTTPGGTTNQTSILDLSHATAATGSATDTTLTLHPKLYSDPGNPCVGIVDNVRVATAPVGCGIPYVDLGSNLVAGSEVVTTYAGPKSIAVQSGVQPALATSIGNGWEVTDALRQWAIGVNAPTIIPLTETTGQTADALYATLKAKNVASTHLPACVEPTSLRLVEIDAAAQGYMQGLGWPIPSTTAVVATYDVCPGMTVTFSDGTSTTLLGHTQKVSIVITGGVNTVVPFGPIFVEDGWAPCGPSALRSACG